MRKTRMAWPVLGLILLAAIHAKAAPEPEPEPGAKDLPADVDAKPAIDLAKLADNAVLRVNDAANRTGE